jgi:hypothetical protein
MLYLAIEVNQYEVYRHRESTEPYRRIGSKSETDVGLIAQPKVWCGKEDVLCVAQYAIG